MATSTDWPLTDDDGRSLYYHPTTTAPPLTRGVLHISTRGLPTVQWQRLMDTFGILLPRINMVSYHVGKVIEQSKHAQCRSSIEKALALAFPNQPQPVVAVFNQPCRGKAGTYIGITTELPVYELVMAAQFYKWSVGGQLLGTPWFVGLQTDEMLQGVQFTLVPDARKLDFVKALPSYFEKDFDRSNRIELIDVWENQSRTSKEADWKFDGTITALVCIKDMAADSTKLEGIVRNWPGWLHWDQEHLICLKYPGRFDCCTRCKHTAQDLEGPTQRHTLDKCITIICGVCGHRGHDSSIKEPIIVAATHKRACEEGQEERRRVKARMMEEMARQQEVEQTRALQKGTAQTDTQQVETPTGTERQATTPSVISVKIEEENSSAATSNVQSPRTGCCCRTQRNSSRS